MCPVLEGGREDIWFDWGGGGDSYPRPWGLVAVWPGGGVAAPPSPPPFSSGDHRGASSGGGGGSCFLAFIMYVFVKKA